MRALWDLVSEFLVWIMVAAAVIVMAVAGIEHDSGGASSCGPWPAGTGACRDYDPGEVHP